jgi:hypothetical protein
MLLITPYTLIQLFQLLDLMWNVRFLSRHRLDYTIWRNLRIGKHKDIS